MKNTRISPQLQGTQREYPMGTPLFAAIAGMICLTWAFLAWLTVIPNQDILADAYQLQTLKDDPRIVLSFPGQKHAGPLEYIFLLPIEIAAPANYWLLSLPRLLLAFGTGFLTAVAFVRLFPSAMRWPLLVAIAVGPSAMHGLMGPEGNTVGVWWMQPNWSMAWLLVVAGICVVSGHTPQHQGLRALLAGVLVGFGFFAHPAIILLIVPLVALTILRIAVTIKELVIAGMGFVLGVIPAAMSYVVNAGLNTWDPSHPPIVDFRVFLATLGVDGIPEYGRTLLPYSLGLVPSDMLLPVTVKSGLMWIVLFLLIVVTAIGISDAIRQQRRPSGLTAIASAWLIAVFTMLLFSVVIGPVWLYATGLAVLFWLTLGALPSSITPKFIAWGIFTLITVVTALSTASHNADFYSAIPTRISEKQHYLQLQQEIADAIQGADIPIVFGSYLDVIPIGYASAGDLRPITLRYNRFPLTDEEVSGDPIPVAVNTMPTDEWGVDVLRLAQTECSETKRLPAPAAAYSVFSCPVATLQKGKPERSPQ